VLTHVVSPSTDRENAPRGRKGYWYKIMDFSFHESKLHLILAKIIVARSFQISGTVGLSLFLEETAILNSSHSPSIRLMILR
jgi:hypothetical protein